LPDWSFGVLLRKLREDRGLSTRELARLSEIDHAYIYRLETGEKEAPSDDVLGKLIRVLKPAKREAEMLRYLAQHRETPVDLVKCVLADPSVSFGLFSAAAGAAFRGKTRPDYPTLIKRMREALGDDDDG